MSVPVWWYYDFPLISVTVLYSGCCSCMHVSSDYWNEIRWQHGVNIALDICIVSKQLHFYGKPVGHWLLLIAHWLLLVACKSKVGAQLIHFVVFPVSSAKNSQSMIITVIIGHLPYHCSSATAWHYVFTAHPNRVHINTILVRLHMSFCSLPHNLCTYTLKK